MATISEQQFSQLLSEVVKECIREGLTIELDGLGTFHPDDRHNVAFEPETAPRVFVAYVVEDAERVMTLVDGLEQAGVRTWMDRLRLLPGQDWKHCIERAIETSDFFIACFSTSAVTKRGQFPYELRYAMRCAERMPLDDSFVIPVRLEECPVPRTISWHLQYVDLFPSWEHGLQRLITSIQSEHAQRLQRRCS
jgi:hypothetical protein